MWLCTACGSQEAFLERPHGSTGLAQRPALPAAAPELPDPPALSQPL